MRLYERYIGISEKKGYLIWGPYNKDPAMVLYQGPLFSETPI